MVKVINSTKDSFIPLQKDQLLNFKTLKMHLFLANLFLAYFF